MSTRRLEGSAQQNTVESPLQGRLRDTLPGGRWSPIVVALGTLLATLWPTSPPWRDALGSPLGEAHNHLWMLWRAAHRVAGDAGPWANLPDGVAIPLMDPANLPPYLVGALLDPVIGWNLLAAWCVALALWGGWLLGREVGGRDVALVTMVATGSAPFLAGVIDFGITEAWPLGWLALHAGLLLRFGRTGRWRDALLAGAALGALALTGWYHALFGLFAEAGLVAWALARGGWRRGPGVVLQGLLALVMTLPKFIELQAVRGLWRGRWHAPSPQAPPPRPDWHELPIQGTDLLNLVLPSTDAVDPSKATYLGLVVLLLAGIGLVKRVRPAGAALLVAGPLLLLALGSWPAVGGRPLGVPGLAWLLATHLPGLQGVSHWHRAVGAAVPFVALAAGLGAASLLRGRGLLVLCGLVLVDALACSDCPWPRRTWPLTAPAVLLAAAERADASGPVGVIQLPFDNGREMFSTQPARLYDRWQVRHGLPRAESYESADALLARSALVAGWQNATALPLHLPPEQLPPRVMREAEPMTDPAAVAVDLGRLRDWGYGFVVLHTDRAVDPEAGRAAIEAALGPGEPVGDDLLWVLRYGAPPAPGQVSPP